MTQILVIILTAFIMANSCIYLEGGHSLVKTGIAKVLSYCILPAYIPTRIIYDCGLYANKVQIEIYPACKVIIDGIYEFCCNFIDHILTFIYNWVKYFINLAYDILHYLYFDIIKWFGNIILDIIWIMFNAIFNIFKAIIMGFKTIISTIFTVIFDILGEMIFGCDKFANRITKAYYDAVCYLFNYC